MGRSASLKAVKYTVFCCKNVQRQTGKQTEAEDGRKSLPETSRWQPTFKILLSFSCLVNLAMLCSQYCTNRCHVFASALMGIPKKNTHTHTESALIVMHVENPSCWVTSCPFPLTLLSHFDTLQQKGCLDISQIYLSCSDMANFWIPASSQWTAIITLPLKEYSRAFNWISFHPIGSESVSTMNTKFDFLYKI